MSIIASSSHGDPDSRSLQVLLEAFGSRFSLDDITAAYCQASQDVNVAGEILFAMTEKTPQCDQVNMKKETSKPSHVYVPKKVQGHEDRKAKVWRPKKNSISVGTITGAIGKEYVRTRPLLNPPREATKPMKIDSRDIPEAVIWSHEMPQSNEANLSRAPTNFEEFIVKMLVEGFQVSEDVIHQVLGVCGYDVTKTTEKLIDLSDTKKYADVGISNEVTSKVDPQRQGSASGDQVELQEFSQSDGARILISSQKGVNAKTGLEKEVLEALFSGTARYEEEPKITRRFGERRARVAGRPVFKPLEDPFQERVVDVKQSSHTSKEDEDDENEFKAHRKAVHEHWNQMKEYYGAAAEAFFQGEPERARRLMEKGHFFGEKAREADDESIAKMIDVKNDDDSTFEEDEVVRVNLNEHEAKEALRLLKHQFICFSGISSFKYLRVILGDNKENSKSKRRHITKLLEGESIAWSEEDNGLVMMIRVDKIDPKKLSFAKK